MRHTLRLAWLLLVTAPVAAAEYAGTYAATTTDHQTLTVTLQASDDEPGAFSGTLAIGEQSWTLYLLPGEGGTLIGAVVFAEPVGDPVEFQHYLAVAAALTGDVLHLQIKYQTGIQQFSLQRQAGGARQPADTDPASASAALAGRFEARLDDGTAVTLVLQQTAAGESAGQLSIGDRSMPLAGRLAGGQLQGAIQLAPAPAGAQPVEFEHFLYFLVRPTAEGVQLILKLATGETPMLLARAGAAPAVEREVGRLAAVYDGPVQQLAHPQGWFTGVAPASWRVVERGPASWNLDPGPPGGNYREGAVILAWGRLDTADLQKPVEQLLVDYRSELQQIMDQLGFTVGSVTAPELVEAVDVPAAHQEFTGELQGQRAHLWAGALVKREFFLAVLAVLPASTRDTHLPGAKRLLTSLQPQAPQRNLGVERVLVGKRYARPELAGGGNSPAAWYEFHPGNQVSRAGADDAPAGTRRPGDRGQYEVVGDALYLYFTDGQEAALVELGANQVVALVMGETRYQLAR